MKKFFLTSTGTGIGKTFVAQVLIQQLLKKKYSVRAIKPILTGFNKRNERSNDAGLLLNSMGLDISSENISSISPWTFKHPLSPDLAAFREGSRISLRELVGFCRQSYDADVVLIEGIGGIMVPLNQNNTVLDWIISLNAPVLLIVGSYLGTFSHTLTAIGMLKEKAVNIAGIIINESTNQPISSEETAEVISRFTKNIPIQVLPRCTTPEHASDLLPLINRYL